MPFIQMTTAGIKTSPARVGGAFRLQTSEFKTLTHGDPNDGIYQ